MPRMKFRT